jgi:hypothetical protein
MKGRGRGMIYFGIQLSFDNFQQEYDLICDINAYIVDQSTREKL